MMVNCDDHIISRAANRIFIIGLTIVISNDRNAINSPDHIFHSKSSDMSFTSPLTLTYFFTFWHKGGKINRDTPLLVHWVKGIS